MAASAPDDRGCRLGVLAFGDSITNGGGELQWGVALQSWALWVARGLGLPYTGYAVDGAGAADVVGAQIPAFIARTPRPDARYDVGCLYIGVNDVRGAGLGRGRLRARLQRPRWRSSPSAATATLALTAPLGLGLPRAGAKVGELNAIVAAAAAEQGALVVDLASFGGRNFVMADRVHPTAFGQIAIAERALAVLERDGLPARVAPSSLISFTHHAQRAAAGGRDLRLPQSQGTGAGVGGAGTDVSASEETR